MIQAITQYLTLAWLLIRKGKLYSTGIDFNQSRNETLSEWKEFVPASYSIVNTHPSKPSMLKNMVGQAAYFKNALKTLGGHLQSSQSQLSYIRIPKSGSTSMSMAMLKNMYPALERRSVTEKQINFLTDVNLQHVIKQNCTDTFFTITRNPFARLVSVYHDFFETNPSNYIYHDYLFGIIPQKISFADFIDRIALIPDSIKDQHLRPQHCFLKFYELKNISVTLLKLEEVENVNFFLNQYSLQYPHLNKSEKEYDYRNYYTSATIQKVSKIYQIDIEKFGYQKELHELVEYTKSRKII